MIVLIYSEGFNLKLKSIRIYGFKSFAEKVDLNISGNIIAVIGPNGCGKSNIVDALLWCIGEQNPRNLRAQNSEEFIFNGSKARKPLGYAEVSVHFEMDEDHTSPHGKDLLITRRIKRSGESSYMINKKNCRLKDIIDILADSGLGKSGYAVVGQKEIDSALTASPYDRRIWIDEAAGIQKYKNRRDESKKKLESVDEHLLRIEDILSELSMQYEPLREESEKAKQFLIVKEEHDRLEKSFLIHQYQHLAQQNLENCDSLAESKKVLAEQQCLLEQKENSLEKIETEYEDITHKITEMESALHAKHIFQAEIKSKVKVIEEQILSENKFLSQLGDETKRVLQDEEHYQNERSDLIASREKYLIKKNNLKNEIDLFIPLLDKKNSEKKDLEKRIFDIKSSYQKYLKELAIYEQSQLRSLEIEKEIEDILSKLPELQQQKKDLLSELTQYKTELHHLTEKYNNDKKKIMDLKETQKRMFTQKQELSILKSSLSAKSNGLYATLQAYEGFSYGTKSIMEAVKKNQLRNIFQPVIQSIQTEQKYAFAIEVALGGSANDLIVPSELEAKEGIEYLKCSKSGRATFQPISYMKPFSPSPDRNTMLQCNGVIGWANEIVSFSDYVAPVIHNLLGRVLIVDRMDHAFKIAKSPLWNKIITLEGELIHSSGAVTGGNHQKTSSGILQRRMELKNIEKRIQQIEDDIVLNQKKLDDHQKEILSLDEKIEEYSNSINAQETLIYKRENVIEKMNDQIIQVDHKKQKLEQSLINNNTPEPDIIEEADIQKIEHALSQVHEDLMEIKTNKQIKEDQQKQLTHKLDEISTKILAIEKKNENIKKQLEINLQKSHTAKERLSFLRSEKDLAGKELYQGIDQNDTVQKDLELLEIDKKALKENILHHKNDYKKLQAEIKTESDQVYKLEIAGNKLSVKLSNLIASLDELYSIKEEDISAQNHLVSYEASFPSRIQALKKELKNFGQINLAAIESYEKLASRYELLSVEHKDILESKEELLKAIKELDSLTKEQFLTTFMKVREEFKNTFLKIFQDGHADLILTDPEKLLNTGIQVEITLPGKKKQRLELLSGGERSLCACALLFALLKVNPTPIVVLDEIDAPLDGRNVEKFVDILSEHAHETQFMLITHNPITIESATTWIGVTMQEPGVTSIVPYQPDKNIPSSNHAFAR